MINLLPPSEQKELLVRKNEKLAIVLGSTFSISMVCLILVLFSLRFYILGEVVSQSIILDNIQKKYQTPNFLSLKGFIQKYNSALIKVDSFYKKEIYFSDALKTISNIQKPKGLYLTNVSVSKIKEDNKMVVAISGVSDTRNNLLIFKNNLEDEKKIKNIHFPPDYWTKPVDVNFNLTFEILPTN